MASLAGFEAHYPPLFVCFYVQLRCILRGQTPSCGNSAKRWASLLWLTQAWDAGTCFRTLLCRAWHNRQANHQPRYPKFSTVFHARICLGCVR